MKSASRSRVCKFCSRKSAAYSMESTSCSRACDASFQKSAACLAESPSRSRACDASSRKSAACSAESTLRSRAWTHCSQKRNTLDEERAALALVELVSRKSTALSLTIAMSFRSWRHAFPKSSRARRGAMLQRARTTCFQECATHISRSAVCAQRRAEARAAAQLGVKLARPGFGTRALAAQLSDNVRRADRVIFCA